MKRLSLLFILCLALFAALPAFAQEPPAAFNLAVADLSARVGRPLTQADFATFSWAQDVYPDSSFGCPTPPGDVVAGAASAYVVTIALDGVTYDYRVAADGSSLFLCSQTGAGAVPEVTAEPGTPAAIPECPTGFVDYLTPRLTPATQAVVIGTSPNRLRSAPTTSAGQIGLLEPGMALMVVAGPACADGFVWWQVNDGNQTGWTAEGQLPDAYWLEPAGDVAVEVTPEATSEAALTPQLATVSGNVVSLWALAEDGLRAVGEIALPPLSANGYVAQLAFNRAATQVLMRTVDYVDNATVTSLYVADALPGATPQLVADGLFDGMSSPFLPNGELLYAVQDNEREVTQPAQGGGLVAGQVFMQAAGEERILLTNFDFGVGCGGGWAYPAVGAYDLETGYGGRPLILGRVDQGLLISTNCTGSGLALIDFEADGEDTVTVLGDHLSRAVLSPDRTQVAALDDDPARTGTDTLTVIDLATGEARALETMNAPQQVAWTSDGRLLYSSTAETGEMVEGSTEAAFTGMGFTDGIPARDVMITALDPDTGEETVIYTGPGYQIGRLLPLPNGDVLFTVIPLGEAWVDATNAGTLGTDITSAQLFETFFRPALLVLSPSTGNVSVVGEGFLAALNTTALAEG